MKTNLKATHAAFITALDAALLGMGAEKYVYAKAESFRPEVPGYRFETRHGTLELHPDMPWKPDKGRAVYDITVFGRFPDAERAARSLGRWKWNHHFGFCFPHEVEGCVTHLAQRLSLMLPQTEAQPGAVSALANR